MQRLDHLATYFREKDRRKLAEKTQESKTGLPEMTKEEIRLSCIENDGYDTPELNDKLFLHFRGFRRIENLDAYTGCKAIWLDSNGFTQIEGLDKLTELRCLYLAKNLIHKISGLDNLSNLTVLDLSFNRVTKIENLTCCPNLQTLNLSRNALATAESIEQLAECASLQTVDLSNNNLDGDLFPIFAAMASLSALSLNGNPVTQQQGFRKKALVAIKNLNYLDRPVQEQEVLAARAFMEGGVEAERKARDDWREAQKNKRINEMEEFRQWQKEQQEKRAQARAEGRSLITEFTPEEMAQRQAEAQAAADAEKRMLDLGIGTIAKHYWQNENAKGDPLEAAMQRAFEEEGRMKQQAIDRDANEEPRVEEITETVKTTTVVTDIQGDVSVVHKVEEVAVEEVIVEVDTTGEESAATEEEWQMLEKEEATPDASGNPVDVSVDAVLQEKELEAIREQRVADSWAIYKAQLEQKTVEPAVTPSATWNVPPVSKPKYMYWTEWMDIKISQLVRLCVFDFDAIAEKMKEAAAEDSCDAISRSALANISSEDCRIRWSQLDAKQWSEVDNENITPSHKIFIKPDVLGKGHGAQPSYSALSSIAAGSMPSYLTPPTSFPSVEDHDGEDDVPCTNFYQLD